MIIFEANQWASLNEQQRKLVDLIVTDCNNWDNSDFFGGFLAW